MSKSKSVKPAKSIFSNPKYAGKYVLVSKTHIFAESSSKKASWRFGEIIKNEKKPPLVTYVPKEQSLILWRLDES